MSIRRWFALRKRDRVLDNWPILPGSEKRPQGWPGWPDRKQFAFVLTHDVEGPDGLAKCRPLMELEMKLGFRSSFNFVPEGDYVVPRQLIQELKTNGFEVGVHDLHHDGKLYKGRGDFAQKATRINHYLENWGAVGFRSGFMFHNLDWLHDLNVAYDASTFDIDPFEPQPDGVGTIFPFWVQRNGECRVRSVECEPHPSSSPFAPRPSRLNGGYVELPYTLPQDSTLFLLFGERHPDIWFQKLDWIAKHGGMALVNVHPDYLRFENESASRRTFPIELYSRFLEYALQRYKGAFWQPLPRELAEWYIGRHHFAPESNGKADGYSVLKGKKAAVLLYSYYPSDARPRREAEALVKAGMEVDLICLRQDPSQPSLERVNGVNVCRVPFRHRRESKWGYLWQYSAFIGYCVMALGYRSLRKRYDLVHVHNMPDVLVFSAVIPKLLGARVLLDLHDPMPELMMTIFGFSRTNSLVRLLEWAEKSSIRFADRVVTVNLACKRIFGCRSCPPEKIQVIMNSPDPEIFKFQRFEEAVASDSNRPFVIMYHGSIVERNGLDLAVQSVAILQKKIRNLEFRIYGTRTPFLDRVLEGAKQVASQGVIRYMGTRTLEQVAQEINECDVGIIPNRRSIFSEINTPIRILEYLSRGKPAVAPNAPGITDYFGEHDLFFFESGDAEGLARQIEYIYFHPCETSEVVERGQKVHLAHSWTEERKSFLDMITGLFSSRRTENGMGYQESREKSLVTNNQANS